MTIRTLSLLTLCCLTLNGFSAEEQQAKRFTRFFAFGQLADGAMAEAAQAIGVTDITVNIRKMEQVKLAHEYGMKAYAGFGPQGAKSMKMSPEEQALQNRLNGRDIPLPKNATPEEKAEKKQKVLEFVKESKTQYGGEPLPDAPYGDVIQETSRCFVGTNSYEIAKELLRKICAIEELDGVYFDYIGYPNFKGCYCDDCEALYHEGLAAQNLTDLPEHRTNFYREQLVRYNNTMVDFIKSLRPDFKVMTHVYPVFLAEPLYGNRLKTDFCGQTAAWYFLWPREKIVEYSKIITAEQNRYFPEVKGVPFLGFYNVGPTSAFPVKTAERVEMELQAMLEGGADSVMICSLNSVLDNPEVSAVFKKYCTDGD